VQQVFRSEELTNVAEESGRALLFQHGREERSLQPAGSRMEAAVPGPLISRYVIGAGGFIGEVTLFELSPEDFYVRGRDRRRYVELSDLHVHPLRRRRGWADVLIKAALREARNRDWPVFLRAIPYNKPALDKDDLIAFYKRYGFKSTRNDKREMVLKW
jgi:GNAT superfamily N-acetyltransferase